MKRLMLLAAVAATISSGIDVAAAAELPTYESADFPITALQLSVVGSAHVQEAPSVPVLTLGGMPASPHQIEVLTARKKILEGKPQSRQQQAEASH
jgi:formate-dependent nitrite reductase membrane component NrfD